MRAGRCGPQRGGGAATPSEPGIGSLDEPQPRPARLSVKTQGNKGRRGCPASNVPAASGAPAWGPRLLPRGAGTWEEKGDAPWPQPPLPQAPAPPIAGDPRRRRGRAGCPPPHPVPGPGGSRDRASEGRVPPAPAADGAPGGPGSAGDAPTRSQLRPLSRDASRPVATAALAPPLRAPRLVALGPVGRSWVWAQMALTAARPAAPAECPGVFTAAPRRPSAPSEGRKPQCRDGSGSLTSPPEPRAQAGAASSVRRRGGAASPPPLHLGR